MSQGKVTTHSKYLVTFLRESLNHSMFPLEFEFWTLDVAVVLPSTIIGVASCLCCVAIIYGQRDCAGARAHFFHTHSLTSSHFFCLVCRPISRNWHCKCFAPKAVNIVDPQRSFCCGTTLTLPIAHPTRSIFTCTSPTWSCVSTVHWLGISSMSK